MEVRITNSPPTTEEAGREATAHRPDRDHDRVRHVADPARDHRPVPLAPGEKRRGALSNSYSIPQVRVLRARKLPYFMMIAAVTGLGATRHAEFISLYRHYLPLMAAWTLVFAMALAQWTLAIFERPYTGWSSGLDRLKVVVSVPVYNEDPATLDLVLFALAGQTRLPQVIHVVDDGSTVDYEKVLDHWLADGVLGPRLIWSRQPNAGKKHAQAACFRRHPDANIFVTVDSDAVLAGNAIEEGLKPFLHDDVYSVAGLELAYNHAKNWLTLLTSSRTLSWQLLSCAAQHVAGGDITVNRGTYALYRADMIRDVLPAYLDETFLGRPVKLGDDAALTLFAQCRGRAVQQPTAVCLAMYPENLRHHFRQWIRWMRGSTIRTAWRMRYLPLSSWSFWFTMINTWTFVVSIGATIAMGLLWPRSEPYLASATLATIAWAILMAMRTAAVRRSDQNWMDRLINVLIAPATAVWVTLVLRPLRVYGILTCLRQGWITRRRVEILTTPTPRPRLEKVGPR
jgi:hyaluronan synthase